ncbi:hypothetical protein PCC7418_0239 [Halothece sp. PCC 7418]|uniref:hypothetical protein n=1 Tax=Halothece sp. (strain PCC 7418) TaxID=65093 RepID=UPI0002A08627|nr:hypothetical protein [Halothece sp. PCC 7418]AFZ42476.1 hypothetical protein PCC7418_0239 [Halothece sp. PCC 7418]
MSKFHQKRNSPKGKKKQRPFNMAAVLGLTVGLFVIIYLWDFAVQSYFAPPPEYSEEYQDTYRQLREQDPTKNE